MTMFQKISLTTFLSFVALPSTQLASEAYVRDQPNGYVVNYDGKKCSFTQTNSDKKYLYESPRLIINGKVWEAHISSITGSTGHLQFEDTKCMTVGDINKMNIANLIVKPYSHSDAAFLTRPGEFKKNIGFLREFFDICIQSATYSGIAVQAKFQIKSGNILGVKHIWNIGGCES